MSLHNIVTFIPTNVLCSYAGFRDGSKKCSDLGSLEDIGQDADIRLIDFMPQSEIFLLTRRHINVKRKVKKLSELARCGGV